MAPRPVPRIRRPGPRGFRCRGLPSAGEWRNPAGPGDAVRPAGYAAFRKTRLGAILLAGACLLLPAGSARAEGPPRRIVSLNMCADQLLLAPADPGQIAGLSRFARDPRLNALADAAAAYPTAPAAAEAVLMLEADLVLTGGFTPAATRDLLAAQGIRLGEVDSVESIDAARDQIRTLAATLGHPERGDALIADIDAALARARAEVDGAGRTALYLQRRGYGSGARTLVGDLLARLGFTSAAGAFGVGSVGAVPLERLVADPPDILILGALNRTAEDQGTALLAHPALARSVDPARVGEFPEILSICGGPVLPRAITTLADGLAAHPAIPRK